MIKLNLRVGKGERITFKTYCKSFIYQELWGMINSPFAHMVIISLVMSFATHERLNVDHQMHVML